MGDRWIPDDNGKFATMATSFASTIAKDPQKYTLDEHDAEMLTRAGDRGEPEKAATPKQLPMSDAA